MDAYAKELKELRKSLIEQQEFLEGFIE